METEHLKEMSPYELGLTQTPDAVPLLIAFLTAGRANERRLAASAIRKLLPHCREACAAAIEPLLDCLRDPAPQVRQYALSCLMRMPIPREGLAAIQKVADGDEKRYNRDAAIAILRKYPRSTISEARKDVERLGNTVDARDALLVIRPLVEGADPITGEELPENSIYTNPKVVQALKLCLTALAQFHRDETRTELPLRHGLHWSSNEDDSLRKSFLDDEVPIWKLAAIHERTQAAIQSRLTVLGCLQEPEH